MRKDYSVQQLCTAFGVSKSGYYAYLKRPVYAATARDAKDIAAIQALYNQSKGTYGAKRIAGTLKQKKGHIINHKRVARLMKEMNIQAKIRKMRTNKLKKEISVGFIYDNLLQRNFQALLPNKKWVMDVTEITMGTDKLYISAMMDLFNREVISLEMSTSPNLDLMEKTISRAQEYRQLPNLKDVIIHTDQGGLYRSIRYHQLSKQLHFIPSMSRKANCWDNAVIECFFSHFKTELPYHFSVETIKELVKEIPKFIDYFNQQRSQKRLGYMSPVDYFLMHRPA